MQFKHPSKVCMSYVKHMKFSLYLSYNFSKASVASFIHAFYPDSFVTYSSDITKKIMKDMDEIGCKK